MLPRNLYCYADIIIASAWPLENLSPSETSTNPAIDIRPLHVPPREPANSDWIHHWPPGYGELSLARTGEGFLLRFPGLADFAISKDGRQIEVWPAPVTGIETLCHLLLDQVLPRTLAQQGRLVLHAGAAQVGSELVAFMGDRGSGKSTLTASFHAAGYPLFCDDGLVLTPGKGSILALPTYPSLRLWPDAISSLYAQGPVLAPMAHYSSKRRIIMTDISAKTGVMLPLTSFYVLGAVGGDASISLSRLSPSEACIAIITNSFQLDVTDRRSAVELFALASSIAEHLPVFSLTYPRDFARLPEVHEAILRRLKNSPRRHGNCPSDRVYETD